MKIDWRGFWVWALVFFLASTVFNIFARAIGLQVDLFGEYGATGVIADAAILIGSWMLGNRARTAYVTRRANKK